MFVEADQANDVWMMLRSLHRGHLLLHLKLMYSLSVCLHHVLSYGSVTRAQTTTLLLYVCCLRDDVSCYLSLLVSSTETKLLALRSRLTLEAQNLTLVLIHCPASDGITCRRWPSRKEEHLAPQQSSTHDKKTKINK